MPTLYKGQRHAEVGSEAVFYSGVFLAPSLQPAVARLVPAWNPQQYQGATDGSPAEAPLATGGEDYSVMLQVPASLVFRDGRLSFDAVGGELDPSMSWVCVPPREDFARVAAALPAVPLVRSRNPLADVPAPFAPLYAQGSVARDSSAAERVYVAFVSRSGGDMVDPKLAIRFDGSGTEPPGACLFAATPDGSLLSPGDVVLAGGTGIDHAGVLQRLFAGVPASLLPPRRLLRPVEARARGLDVVRFAVDTSTGAVRIMSAVPSPLAALPYDGVVALQLPQPQAAPAASPPCKVRFELVTLPSLLPAYPGLTGPNDGIATLNVGADVLRNASGSGRLSLAELWHLPLCAIRSWLAGQPPQLQAWGIQETLQAQQTAQLADVGGVGLELGRSVHDALTRALSRDGIKDLMRRSGLVDISRPGGSLLDSALSVDMRGLVLRVAPSACLARGLDVAQLTEVAPSVAVRVQEVPVYVYLS